MAVVQLTRKAAPSNKHLKMLCGLCTQMLLLDRAIKLAAEQDEPLEMNFVRKHAMQQVRVLWFICAEV